MNKYSDEVLMAFADGELDAATRGAIEQAMRQDPAMAQRVAAHQALRAHVSAAFAPVLDEPAPARLTARVQSMANAPLLQKAAPPRGGIVIQLAAVRASKGQAQAVPVKSASRWSWPQWGALVATLVVGVVAGRFAIPWFYGEPSVPSLMADKGGALIARGPLAGALTQQSASDTGSRVKIGLSFVSKQGSYCRSFVLADGGGMPGMAGLACQSGAGWVIAAIAEEDQPAFAPESYRMAGAQMPPAILAAIDQRIVGQALEAAEEQQALRRGWRRE